MWKRCAEGQTWSGATCTGSASTVNWADALKSTVSATTVGYSDWRLPNLKELQSIVEDKCYAPAINTSIFPNTPASLFWSASASASNSSFVWVVDFSNGFASKNVKYYGGQVRLVRAGQSFGAFDSYATVPLSVVKTGTGTVSSNPAGISCGATCSAGFSRDTSVVLTATPTAVSTFTGWSGACSGMGTCNVTMNQAQNVTAIFELLGTGGVNALLSFSTGWNLVGNSVDARLDVATTLADATRVASVWKWVSSGVGKWAFYTPSLAAQDLSDYLVDKGYDALTTINAGEAFWVNAKTAFTVQLLGGAAVTSTSFQSLSPGWHLIATGDTKTPSGFNTALSVTPPATGVVPQNFTSLWAWDSSQSKWYFYAPSIEAQGGTALTDYITSHGYLDFNSANRTLGAGVGFWVNKP